jgi:hypothetical protein
VRQADAAYPPCTTVMHPTPVDRHAPNLAIERGGGVHWTEPRQVDTTAEALSLAAGSVFEHDDMPKSDDKARADRCRGSMFFNACSNDGYSADKAPAKLFSALIALRAIARGKKLKRGKLS